MYNDIRLPTAVVAGHWNPHIFSIDWVAHTLFGTPDGQAVEITQMVDGSRNVVANYLFGVGFACTAERLEIYITEATEDGAKRAEKFLFSVLDTLSHTPVSGIGFNYAFRSGEVEAQLADAFVTPEDLRSRYAVIVEDHRTRVQFDQTTLLNLSRKISRAGAEISFNFHHDVSNAGQAKGFVEDAIWKHRVNALKILEELYGQSDVEVVTHTTADKGEDAIVA